MEVDPLSNLFDLKKRLLSEFEALDTAGSGHLSLDEIRAVLEASDFVEDIPGLIVSIEAELTAIDVDYSALLDGSKLDKYISDASRLTEAAGAIVEQSQGVSELKTETVTAEGDSSEMVIIGDDDDESTNEDTVVTPQGWGDPKYRDLLETIVDLRAVVMKQSEWITNVGILGLDEVSTLKERVMELESDTEHKERQIEELQQHDVAVTEAAAELEIRLENSRIELNHVRKSTSIALSRSVNAFLGVPGAQSSDDSGCDEGDDIYAGWNSEEEDTGGVPTMMDPAPRPPGLTMPTILSHKPMDSIDSVDVATALSTVNHVEELSKLVAELEEAKTNLLLDLEKMREDNMRLSKSLELSDQQNRDQMKSLNEKDALLLQLKNDLASAQASNQHLNRRYESLRKEKLSRSRHSLKKRDSDSPGAASSTRSSKPASTRQRRRNRHGSVVSIVSTTSTQYFSLMELAGKSITMTESTGEGSGGSGTPVGLPPLVDTPAIRRIGSLFSEMSELEPAKPIDTIFLLGEGADPLVEGDTEAETTDVEDDLDSPLFAQPSPSPGRTSDMISSTTTTTTTNTTNRESDDQKVSPPMESAPLIEVDEKTTEDSSEMTTKEGATATETTSKVNVAKIHSDTKPVPLLTSSISPIAMRTKPPTIRIDTVDSDMPLPSLPTPNSPVDITPEKGGHSAKMSGAKRELVLMDEVTDSTVDTSQRILFDHQDSEPAYEEDEDEVNEIQTVLLTEHQQVIANVHAYFTAHLRRVEDRMSVLQERVDTQARVSAATRNSTALPEFGHPRLSPHSSATLITDIAGRPIALHQSTPLEGGASVVDGSGSLSVALGTHHSLHGSSMAPIIIDESGGPTPATTSASVGGRGVRTQQFYEERIRHLEDQLAVALREKKELIDQHREELSKVRRDHHEEVLLLHDRLKLFKILEATKNGGRMSNPKKRNMSHSDDSDREEELERRDRASTVDGEGSDEEEMVESDDDYYDDDADETAELLGSKKKKKKSRSKKSRKSSATKKKKRRRKQRGVYSDSSDSDSTSDSGRSRSRSRSSSVGSRGRRSYKSGKRSRRTRGGRDDGSDIVQGFCTQCWW